jgi:transposase InsO family protein
MKDSQFALKSIPLFCVNHQSKSINDQVSPIVLSRFPQVKNPTQVGKPQRTTRQRWQRFLKNHSAEIISLNFFVVPTITFKLLFVLVFLSDERRKIIYFNVTDHPTSEWVSQQLRNAFCDEETSRILIRDRDKKFGDVFIRAVSALGIRPILAAYRSSWQNGYSRRLIGSIRRECLDQLIIVNETHSRGILRSYIHHYNTQRTHLGLNKDSPEPRGTAHHTGA